MSALNSVLVEHSSHGGLAGSRIPRGLIAAIVALGITSCGPEQTAPDLSDESSSQTANNRPAIRGGYIAVDLGTLGGNFSHASHINAKGQVVGFSRTAGGELHTFLWSRGVMTDLGRLSIPGGINPRGEVVVGSFIWYRGVLTDLRPPGVSVLTTSAINPSGQVVGWRNPEGAFLWNKGVFTDLRFSPQGTFDDPTAINPAGKVVGEGRMRDNDGESHAVLWSNGTLFDLGTLGGTYSRATDINPAGEVVGFSSLPGEDDTHHPFLWRRGRMTDLGTLNTLGGYFSEAYAINAAGQVVGQWVTGTGQTHGFVWARGTMTDLAPLGGRFSRALDINSQGQIVGVSSTAGGELRATMWTPQ